MKNKEIIFLISVLLLSAILRLWRIDTDLLFHRDQGVHALGAWSIWHDRELKLLGHPTDVDGIFHGSLYYHLLSIPYFLSSGNPVTAVVFQILLEVTTLPFLYLGLTKLFNKKTAMLTLILYSVSHMLIGYSRWLNNVPPILPVANILIFLIAYQLHQWTQKRWLIISLLIGLVAQLDGAMAFSLIPAILFIFRSQLNLKTLSILLIGIVLPSLPQILFELRHDYVSTKAILGLFQGGDGFSFSLLPFYNTTRTFLEQISYMISYKYSVFSTALFILALLFSRSLSTKTIRLVWSYLFISILTYGLLRRGAIGFFFIHTWPLMLALIGWAILQLHQYLVLPIIFALILINLTHNQSLLYPSAGLTPIGTSNLTTIQDRRNIVDWVYAKAEGNPFATWFYVLPYFQDEPWRYSFLWYGQQQFGYLPEKMGGFSPNDLKEATMFFAIFEPDYDRPENLLKWQTQVEKNFGPVKESYRSHDLFVEQHTWSRLQ